jgi:hypothetical protein
MRTVIHTTVGQRTISIIHRVMEEKNFHKKSEALDYIITEYEARKRTDHLDEVAERVIWKLKRERDF